MGNKIVEDKYASEFKSCYVALGQILAFNLLFYVIQVRVIKFPCNIHTHINYKLIPKHVYRGFRKILQFLCENFVNVYIAVFNIIHITTGISINVTSLQVRVSMYSFSVISCWLAFWFKGSKFESDIRQTFLFAKPHTSQAIFSFKVLQFLMQNMNYYVRPWQRLRIFSFSLIFSGKLCTLL